MGATDGQEGDALNGGRPQTLRSLAEADLLQLLQQSGSKTAAAAVLAGDVAAGLPRNADGTFDLMTVAAWLVRESGDRNK